MARLPGILHNQIEALAGELLAAPGVPPTDFAAPQGEPALLPPESVSWRVFDNPVTLFIGGIAAVLLELAEPRIRHGVWDHSDFRTNPLARMQRTGLAALVTVYAPERQARAMIAGVTRAHGGVTGTTPAGEAYSASDPDLLDWVGATALYGFMEAYSRYHRPLSPADKDRVFAEGRTTAGLYGATGAPDSVAGWDALLARMRPRLEPSETLLEFLAIMRRVPALPAAARPLQHVLIRAAVDILPAGIAARLRIADRGLRPLERPLVQAAARTAGTILIRNWPSVAACRRLGLPDDWLRRRD